MSKLEQVPPPPGGEDEIVKHLDVLRHGPPSPEKAADGYNTAWIAAYNWGQQYIGSKFRGGLAAEDLREITGDALLDFLGTAHGLLVSQLLRQFVRALERHKKRWKRRRARAVNVDARVLEILTASKTEADAREHLDAVLEELYEAIPQALGRMTSRYHDCIAEQYDPDRPLRLGRIDRSADTKKRALRQFKGQLEDILDEKLERTGDPGGILEAAIHIVATKGLLKLAFQYRDQVDEDQDEID